MVFAQGPASRGQQSARPVDPCFKSSIYLFSLTLYLASFYLWLFAWYLKQAYVLQVNIVFFAYFIA